MSDHPEVPRVVFNDDGESMNVEQAVERFRLFLLADPGNVSTFTVEVEVNPCDCHQDIRGRSDICPLHGDPEQCKKVWDEPDPEPDYRERFSERYNGGYGFYS